MTRNRWTGLAGIVFGIGFLALGAVAGSTPDPGKADSTARFAKYWSDSAHQSRAVILVVALSYLFLVFLGFAAGLWSRLREVDTGPLPSFALAAGTAAAALLMAGAAVSSATGVAGDRSSGFKADGATAVTLDTLGYGILGPGLMAAAVMAVITGILTLRTRVLPVWTAWLGFLFGLTAVGSYATAWIGFLVMPVWCLVVGGTLLLRSEPVPEPAAV